MFSSSGRNAVFCCGGDLICGILSCSDSFKHGNTFTLNHTLPERYFPRLLIIFPGEPIIVFVNSRSPHSNVPPQALDIYWIMCYFLGFSKFIGWSASKTVSGGFKTNYCI